MIELIERNKPALIALCRQFGVKQLDLSRSAAKRTFKPGKRDIDVALEVSDGTPDFGLQCFGFAYTAQNEPG